MADQRQKYDLLIAVPNLYVFVFEVVVLFVGDDVVLERHLEPNLPTVGHVLGNQINVPIVVKSSYRRISSSSLSSN
jgi:hypothetical protein